MTNSYQAFILKNKHNMTVTIGNIGAVIQSVVLPDGTNIVLGLKNLEDYQTKNTAYLGTVIGRLCNRVAKGQFVYNGCSYQLEKNELQKNTLHSGSTGLHQVRWEMVSATPQRLELYYASRDGEGGFPGTVAITVIYQLSDNNALQIDYHATTDHITPLDLTNHTYWNLAGAGKTIVDHDAKFYALRYLETDAEQIPTGKIMTTQNTALDFHDWKKIGNDIHQLAETKGYDHYLVLDNSETKLRLAAEFSDRASQRSLQVYTNQVGFQFYTGNHLNDGFPPYGGFCVETHNYPNAVNHSDFPSPWITPEKPYRHSTVYQLNF
jgi:aldose 1-epimerase